MNVYKHIMFINERLCFVCIFNSV